MKKFVTVIMLVALAVVITASGAYAYSFDFTGVYQFSDTNNDAFSETLTLDGNGGRAPILVFHPGMDAVLGLGSYVVFAPLALDPTNFVSGVSYGFTGNPYLEGFKVYNATDTLLMTADFTLDPLMVDMSTASINAALSINLTNAIQLVSGSPILEAFDPDGALNITLNFSAMVSGMIEQGESHTGTFSGSAIAAPDLTTVPEPTTLLLMGVGLIGMVGVGRKMKR